MRHPVDLGPRLVDPLDAVTTVARAPHVAPLEGAPRRQSPAGGRGTATVARAVVAELERAGVTTVFGIPGLHTLDLYEALASSAVVRHVLVRHEQAAAFAADGYARVTGRAGVCLATTGPGAFNTLTAIAEAWGDSSPVVLLAGQIDAALIGAGAGILHETPDQAGSFRPVTKFAATPRDGPSVLEAVATALRVAVAGRPRPAYVELPTDLLASIVGDEAAGDVASRRGVERPVAIDTLAVANAARRLATARRPLIVAGGGAVRARAGPALAALAERIGAPVLTTVPGNGAVSADHALFAGTVVASQSATRRLVTDADLVLIVGSRLDAVTTHRGALPLHDIVQIDIDPDSIGRTYPVAVHLIADAKAGVEALGAEIGKRTIDRDDGWGATVAAWARSELRASIAVDRRPFLAAFDAARAVLPRDAITTHDAATLNSWTAYFWPVYEIDGSVFPWASASLGFALPSAIGAALAAPGRRVIAACGDGGFLFTAPELATAARLSLPITVLVHDDGAFSSIAAYQQERFGRTFECDLTNPDLVTFAQAFGIPAWRVDAAGLPRALAASVAEAGPSLVAISGPIGQPW